MNTTTTTATPAVEIDAMDVIVAGLCVHAKAVSKTDRVRHADLIDPVDGEHVWFGDAGAVVVPERHVASFRRYVACRGMVLDLPVGCFRTVGFTLERFDTYFDTLCSIVR